MKIKQLIVTFSTLLLILLSLTGVCSISRNSDGNTDTTSIKASKAYRLIKANQNNPQFVVLDVRKPNDFLKEHIDNAINIDFKSSDFKFRLECLDKSKTYIVICYAGVRSRNTMAQMEKLNFKKVYSIKGGMMKWRGKKLPVTN